MQTTSVSRRLWNTKLIPPLRKSSDPDPTHPIKNNVLPTPGFRNSVPKLLSQKQKSSDSMDVFRCSTLLWPPPKSMHSNTPSPSTKIFTYYVFLWPVQNPYTPFHLILTNMWHPQPLNSSEIKSNFMKSIVETLLPYIVYLLCQCQLLVTVKGAASLILC